MKFIMLINVKMPTIVGILTFYKHDEIHFIFISHLILHGFDSLIQMFGLKFFQNTILGVEKPCELYTIVQSFLIMDSSRW